MKKRIVSLLLGGMLLFAVPMVNMGTANATAPQTTTWIGDEGLTQSDSEAPAADATVPTDAQYQYHKEELAAFCHFGPNTFTGEEWGEHYGDRPPGELFTLSQDFDADTMVRTLKEAGFKRLIVTAKHHDGFCIWASQYTDYDVANTNYKNGQGDILAEISAACTEHDMDMGLYLSPWDIHEPSYGYYAADGSPLVGNNGQPLNGKSWDEVIEIDRAANRDYNEFYKNQLIEILGNDKYGNGGKFVEVWMDGAKGSGSATQNYTFEDWFEVIQREEPGCLLFGAGAYTTVRWIGNEIGYANEETWAKSQVDKTANTINSNQSGANRTTIGIPNGNQWTVPEADARITSGWFWGNNKKTPKTMEELANMYFNSVGHNATLLLNVPPNNQGRVDQDILNRVTEFGNAVKQTFAENLASGATAKANAVRNNDLQFKAGNVLDNDQDTYWTTSDGTATGTLLLELDGVKTFDVVSIEEAIKFGQRISSFQVEYRMEGGEWKTFAQGTTIGGKRLCRDARVKADQVKITVTARESVPMITEVGLFKAADDFKVASGMPSGLTFIDETSNAITYTGTWNSESGSQFDGGTGKWANPSGDFTLSFEGSKIYLIGTVDPNHGTADIYIDGTKVDTIDTAATGRKTKQVIYESEDLTHGTHTLRLVLKERAIGFDGAYVINNGGKGMIGLEYDSYTMYEDDTLNVVINRVGGSTGEVTATLAPNPGSAIQDDFNTDPIPISFADGETQITVPVLTRRNTNATGDQNFYLQLESPSEGLLVGLEETATVTIKDTESFTKEVLEALIEEEETTLEEGSFMSGQEAFQAALEAAREVAADQSADPAAIAQAYKELDNARNALVVRTAYTQEDPFLFPTSLNSSKTLEAELGILNNTGGTSEQWKLSVANGDWASGGKFINCLNTNDTVTYHFRAAKAGTYTVTATYRSGSNNNALSWSGTNVQSGTQSAGHNAASETRTVSFDIVVTASGDGTLVFTGPANNSPQLDKLEITLKESAEPDLDTAAINLRLEEARVILADGKRYTPQSLDDLNTAIAEAEAVLMDEGVTQAILDAKAEQLRSRIQSMTEIDTTAIDKALADAKALLANGKKYETASREALKTAIAEAEAMLADTRTTQQMLESGTAALRNRIGAMVEVKDDPVKPKAWPFTDIPEQSGAWKYDNVKYVYENGIMNGISGTTLFNPDGKLDRAMFATVLHRMAKTPAVAYTDKFSDVKQGKYYTSAILWAAEKKIVSGLSDGSYGVTDNITREQIAKMLYEYAKTQNYDISGAAVLDSFTDTNKVGIWAVNYMKWAVDAGMISGKPNGDGTFRLDPKGAATRAECAKMLTMFLQKYQAQ